MARLGLANREVREILEENSVLVTGLGAILKVLKVQPSIFFTDRAERQPA